MTQQISSFNFIEPWSENRTNAPTKRLKMKRAFSNVPLWAFHLAFAESSDETSISDLLSLAKNIAFLNKYTPRTKNHLTENQRVASEVMLVGGAYEIDDERKAALHVPSVTFKLVRKVASKAGLDAPRWKIVYAYFGGEL